MSTLDTERQDRIDLLRGREKRQEQTYHGARAELLARLSWIEDARRGVSGMPQLTVAMWDTEIADTLAPLLDTLRLALRHWLVTREELAALEGKRK